MDKWGIEEIIESLRQWEDRLYSESETQFLMNKAADYLEQLLAKSRKTTRDEINVVRQPDIDYLKKLLDTSTEPMPMTLKTPPYCVNCPSHPNNGGDGICFCTLGNQTS